MGAVLQTNLYYAIWDVDSLLQKTIVRTSLGKDAIGTMLGMANKEKEHQQSEIIHQFGF